MAWEYDIFAHGASTQRFERMTAAVDEMIKAANSNALIKQAQVSSGGTLNTPGAAPSLGGGAGGPQLPSYPDGVPPSDASQPGPAPQKGQVRPELQKMTGAIRAAKATMDQIAKAHTTLNTLKPQFRTQWNGLIQTLTEMGEQHGQNSIGKSAQRLLAEVRGIRLDQQNPAQLSAWLGEMSQKLTVGAVDNMPDALGQPSKANPNMFGVGPDAAAGTQPNGAPIPAPPIAPTTQVPPMPSQTAQPAAKKPGFGSWFGQHWNNGKNNARSASSAGKFLKQANSDTEWTWKIG